MGPAPAFGSLLLVAALSGMLHGLVQPPHDGAVLAWVALTPLLVGLRSESRPLRAAAAGTCFGAVMLIASAHWIPGVLAEGSGFAPADAALVFAGVAAWYAFGFGLFGALCVRLRRGWLPAPVAVACAWVALEWLRAALVPAASWLVYGHSQQSSLAVLQLAELAGAPGLSWLLVFVNGLAAEACVHASRGGWRRARRLAGLAAATVALAFAAGHARLVATEAGRVGALSVPLAVVQSAVAQAERWQEKTAVPHLEHLLALTREAVSAGARIVVWPETSIEMHLDDATLLPAGVARALSGDASRWLLAGAPRALKPSGTSTVPRFHNSAVLFDGTGTQRGVYDKLDLYPVSETAPDWLFTLPGAAQVFASQLVWEPYSPGPALRLLEADGLALGVLICFEAVGPDPARERVAAGAQMLVQLANDAILPDEAARAQHLAIVRFRAVELRRPLVRASNRGISAGIAASGRVVAMLPAEAPGFARIDLAAGSGQTIFARAGWRLPWLVCGVTLLGLLPRRLRAASRC